MGDVRSRLHRQSLEAILVRRSDMPQHRSIVRQRIRRVHLYLFYGHIETAVYEFGNCSGNQCGTPFTGPILFGRNDMHRVT